MLCHVKLWDVGVETLLLIIRRRVIHKVARRMIMFLMLHEGGMVGLVATMPRQSRLGESVSLSHIV